MKEDKDQIFWRRGGIQFLSPKNWVYDRVALPIPYALSYEHMVILYSVCSGEPGIRQEGLLGQPWSCGGEQMGFLVGLTS